MFEMSMRRKQPRVHLIQGDITRWNGDAIVNAANERMLGGGGVDGAIHSAAGPKLYDACWNVAQVAPGVRCPRGEARITPAFGRLKCRWVIHTVGPIYENEHRSAPILAQAYASVFSLAAQYEIRSIALPAVSCGVYGYPLDAAARIAISSATHAPNTIEEIVFVLFNVSTFDMFSQVLTD